MNEFDVSERVCSCKKCVFKNLYIPLSRPARVFRSIILLKHQILIQANHRHTRRSQQHFQSPAPLNMSGSSAAAEANFLCLKEKTAIGLHIEEVECLMEMIYDVKFFDPLKLTLTNQHMADEPRMARNTDVLFARWNFLDFTKTYPGARNKCSDLEARILVWLDAHLQVGSCFSADEYLFMDLFQGFMQDYSSGKYKHFLPNTERGLTAEESRSLRLGALAKLSNWIQNVLSAVPLTVKQDQDRKTLLDWIEETERQLQ